MYSSKYESPLGELTLASDGENLLGLWLDGQKYHGSSIFESMPEKELPVFKKTKQWLDEYFAGEEPEISDLPLAPERTEFRKKVWKLLCEIPYGEVTTYGEIAKKIAEDKSKAGNLSRAVGGAVGHNPISIIIPCHRVIGSNGSLTGYAGGVDRKIKLLTLEGVDTAKMTAPTPSN